MKSYLIETPGGRSLAASGIRRIALEMHDLIATQAGHRVVADAMTHLTTEAPELERLEAERRAEARRNQT